jgi:hypothetical protein
MATWQLIVIRLPTIQTLGTSTPVKAAADGTFTVTATNFNGYVPLPSFHALVAHDMCSPSSGQDGSTQVTAKVDATASGKSFAAATVSKNGVLAPATTGSTPIVAALPAGTKCTGGASKDLCLASFTTAGGFGNCVVVQQAGGAATGGAAASSGSAAAAGAGAAAAAGTGAKTAAAGTGAKKHHHKGAKQARDEEPSFIKRALALRFARHLTERDD